MISGQDPVRDYLRLMEIQGQNIQSPIFYYSNQTGLWEGDSTSQESFGVWTDFLMKFTEKQKRGFELIPLSPSVTYNFNSKYPRSYNDGPVWNGRGSTISMNAGVAVKWGPFKGVFYPNYFRTQNQEFMLSSRRYNKSKFSYQFAQQIDFVQRFGDSAYHELDFGQSNIGIEFRNFSVKLSSENLWWGPSISNPILVSNAGPGFLHVDLGTAKPWNTKLGDFEFHHVWGRMKESEYFDNDPRNNKKYFVGASFGYRASFLKELRGLSFGIARVLYKRWPIGGLKPHDVFLIVNNFDSAPDFSPNGGNDETDQMTAIFGRWFFEESGIEIYSEWARNDFNTDLKEFFQELDHSMAITLGFQKTFKASDAFWRFGFEHTTLARPRTVELRATPKFYVHDVILGGYTHKGQPIGASIGTGSNNQIIRMDRFSKTGKYSFSIQRLRFDVDAFFENVGPNGFNESRDIELTFGLGYMRFIKDIELSANMYYSKRSNRYFNPDDDLGNFQFSTTLRMHIFNGVDLNF
ncbi:MAG: hypothetical protein O2951_12475 [Bacteroidetes bacterium]|nr:hypothetical protein [Bacteroidota bacterium]